MKTQDLMESKIGESFYACDICGNFYIPDKLSWVKTSSEYWCLECLSERDVSVTCIGKTLEQILKEKNANVEVLVDQILQARFGGKVERCHVIPHAQSYSVASHAWGTAILLRYLWPRDFPRLVLYALTHDIPEIFVGDIPAPTMKYSENVRNAVNAIHTKINKSLDLPTVGDFIASDLEKIKTCDRLEFYLWCRDEISYGNQYPQDPYQEIRQYLLEESLPEPAEKVFRQLDQIEIVPKQRGIIKEIAG